MEWSKFNILCKSPEGRNYLYNSRMNLLLKLAEDTYASFWKNQQNFSLDKLKGDFDEESLDFFIKNKVIVAPGEDDNFILQKKLLRYKRSLNEKNVGFVIVPTYGCNFKCPYCYESNLPMNMMSEKVEVQLIKFIKSFGINEVPISWHGGEPLLAFRRIKSILYKLRDENIKLSDHKLVTNGFLLDDEKCTFFNDFNLQSIQITIDGLENTHNMTRIHKLKIPTYNIIIQNIERVFRLIPNCHVIVRVNVHKGNEEEFPMLHKQLRKTWEGQNFEISMKYVNDHNNGCKVACLKDQDKIQYIEKLVKKDNFSSLSLYPKPKLSGCTATFLNSYVIGTEGELYKCWVDVGKLERAIGNIFDNNRNISLISEYILGTDMFSDKKCLSCSFFPICDGGCNLRRLNFKQNNVKYNVCPIREEDFGTILDLYYNQKFPTQSISQ